MGKPVRSRFAPVNKIQGSGRFRPGNTFTICTNQFHDFPFIKDGFEEMEHKFLFGTFSPENRITFSDDPMLPEMFHSNDSKTSCSIDFSNPIFRTTFINGKQS